MPELIIIAGPNGAGKSTFSAILSSVDALIYDAHKIKLVTEKESPDLPIERIESMLTHKYWNYEGAAIEKKQNFTIETNLRNDFLINRLISFRKAGYSNAISYIYVRTICF